MYILVNYSGIIVQIITVYHKDIHNILNKRIVELKVSKDLVKYDYAEYLMETRLDKCHKGLDIPLIWLLEHEHVITGGMLARKENIINKQNNVQIINSNRGGDYTYHGPGMLIIYFVLPILKYPKIADGPDIRLVIYTIEEVIISTLNTIGITGFRDNKNRGVWVRYSNQNYKIASLGLRVRKMYFFHGIGLNVTTDLRYFDSIIPCGIKDCKINSIQNLGFIYQMQNIIDIVTREIMQKFNIEDYIINQA